MRPSDAHEPVGRVRRWIAPFLMTVVTIGCGSSPTGAPFPAATAPGPSVVSPSPVASLSTVAPSTASASPSGDPVASLRTPIDQLGSRLLATIDVGGEPEWIGAGLDAIWVTNRGLRSVQRIDHTRNAVVASVEVNEPCNGFAFAFGAVWTASCADQSLIRIDPAGRQVTRRISTPVAGDGEGQVAAGFGSVWIAGGDGRLLRLDPTSDRFSASIPIPHGADAVVAGSAAVWLTDPDGNEVLKVDPNTNTVSGRIVVGPHPQFLAASATDVWVLNQDDGTVSRIDAGTGAVRTIATDSPGRDVGCIGAGLDAAWVTVPNLPLTRVDARSGSVTEQFSGPGGDCLTTGFGSIWLVNNALGSVSRIAPSR